MAYRVRLLKQNREVMVSGGTLAQACAQAGYPVNAPCGGNGRCKKCLVKIVSHGRTNQVLACRTMVRQDLDILLEEAEIRIEAGWDKDLEAGKLQGRLNPAVMKEGPCYGMAVDIGSTSVVVYLYDLHTGKRCHIVSAWNRQAVHGADIIARIQYAAVESQLQQLREEIIETINTLIAGCLTPVQQRHIFHVVLCGNSAMQHLFFGWQPQALGRSPYKNVTTDMVRVRGEESGLLCAPDARVEFLPLLGGFVGADTLACLLALPEECFSKNRATLMLDLGTNGELALMKDGDCIVTSTACGPALEGGNLHCGMRSEEGAIDQVYSQGEELHYHWLGKLQRPIGLCGSAVLDLTAELLKHGWIDAKGTFTLGLEDSRMMEMQNGHKAYLLQQNPEIYLSQGDIRQIQMAKSAIITAVETLLARYHIAPYELDALYLSGAFGNYMNVKNAMLLGLLPQMPEEKIHYMGNGAGTGLLMLLLDQDNYAKMQEIKAHTTHISLADQKEFQEKYIDNLNFYL